MKSNCCGANMYQDFCTECKEHCEEETDSEEYDK
tara:strand:- start:1338 stop:1439 length:102 start_codon:yes stop_codon:yes gene_type:complete